MENITIQKFVGKFAKIGIVGLGYISLPPMLRYVDIDYKVLGFDIDAEKVNKLNNGEAYIEHIPVKKITAVSNSLFETTTDFSRIGGVEAVVLCAPTLLNKYHELNMDLVIDITDAVKPYLHAGRVLPLESTTYLGTAGEELLPRVEGGGLRAGEDVFLAYSPEREDLDNPDFETYTILKVIGSRTPVRLEVDLAPYQPAVDKIVPVNSTKAVGLTKLLESIHRAVNIGLVNEIKIVADKMDADIRETIDTVATKSFGFVAYYLGPSLGSCCTLIDPFYLTWKVREYGVDTRSVELAGEVNSSVPEYVINKTALALDDHQRSIKSSKVLVLDIAYEKNADDMCEDSSVEAMGLLCDLGAETSYSDPYIPVLPKTREHKFNLKSVSLTAESIASHDCVVLTTDHDKLGYDLLEQHAKLIVDMRGKYPGKHGNIVKV